MIIFNAGRAAGCGGGVKILTEVASSSVGRMKSSAGLVNTRGMSAPGVVSRLAVGWGIRWCAVGFVVAIFFVGVEVDDGLNPIRVEVAAVWKIPVGGKVVGDKVH